MRQVSCSTRSLSRVGHGPIPRDSPKWKVFWASVRRPFHIRTSTFQWQHYPDANGTSHRRRSFSRKRSSFEVCKPVGPSVGLRRLSPDVAGEH